MDRFDWLELDEGAMRDAIAQRQPWAAALRQAPKDGPTFYRAARKMREAGHFRAAAAYYEKAIGFEDQHYPARAELIDTLVRAHHIEEADRRSYEALDAYRQVRIFYASRALVLAHLGKLDEAYPLSTVSIEGDPKAWYARCVRAELLLKTSKENRVEALDLLEDAADQGKDLWECHFIGGCILLDAGWPALAAGYFSEAAHHSPRAAISWICLGDCFHALRLYPQAMFYYQKAIEVEPKHELALERQKRCAPSIFGLIRVFQRDRLLKRWNKEFEKLINKQEPTVDDF